MRKKAYFERALDAWESYCRRRNCDDLPRLFVCPLCLHGFSEDQLSNLSREHVPPASAGGSRLVLTCRPCNSAGGHSADHAIADRERARAFLAGEKPHRTSVWFDEHDLRQVADVSVTDTGIEIAGLPDRGPPGRVEAVKDILNKRVDQGAGLPKLKLRFPSYDRQRYQVSWLRSGYLAAYAALGYSYIYRSQLDAVRRQVANADQKLLQNFYLELGEQAAGSRAVVIVLDPQWAMGVVVQWDQHLVFLPLKDDAIAYYEQLKSKEGVKVALRGKALNWPSSPTEAQFLFDFD